MTMAVKDWSATTPWLLVLLLPGSMWNFCHSCSVPTFPVICIHPLQLVMLPAIPITLVIVVLPTGYLFVQWHLVYILLLVPDMLSPVSSNANTHFTIYCTFEPVALLTGIYIWCGKVASESTCCVCLPLLRAGSCSYYCGGCVSTWRLLPNLLTVLVLHIAAKWFCFWQILHCLPLLDMNLASVSFHTCCKGDRLRLFWT